MKKMILTASTILLLLQTSIHAQEMYVREQSEDQNNYILNEVRKVHFISGSLVVKKNNATEEQYLLNDVRYVSFNNYMTGINPLINSEENKLIVYPNPVKNKLIIDLSRMDKTQGIIKILSVKGQLIKKIKVSEFQKSVSIDFSEIPLGTYLCHYVYGGQQVKAIKIIKQ